CDPCRAKPECCRDRECKHGSKQQTHDGSNESSSNQSSSGGSIAPAAFGRLLLRPPRRSLLPLRGGTLRVRRLTWLPTGGGEGARRIIHQPFDPQQGISATLGENRRAPSFRGAILFGFGYDWPAGRARDPRDGSQFHPLVGIGHDLVPSLRRQRSAGHLVHGLVIIIAEPNSTDEIAGVADEPGVAV